MNERAQRTQIASDDWVLGEPDSPITLLEYADFECPNSAIVRPVLTGLVLRYPDTIRLVFRHFPMTSVHPHAVMAAEAAEAAGAQGAFWQMHDMLFAHPSQLEYEDLVEYAGSLRIDTVRFEDELAGHLRMDEVKEDFRHGIQDRVHGTPTIFINGRRYDGPREEASIRAAITPLSARTG